MREPNIWIMIFTQYYLGEIYYTLTLTAIIFHFSVTIFFVTIADMSIKDIDC